MIFLMRLLLPIACGFILYLPVISMLMDIFICTAEANHIIFFDIDCNEECWYSTHILHAIFATLAIILVIPGGIVLRIKF